MGVLPLLRVATPPSEGSDRELSLPVEPAAATRNDVLIDAYASQPHYLSHMAPIWRTLSDRGGRLVIHPHVEFAARKLGLEFEIGSPPYGEGPPVLIAGYKDEEIVQRPVILVEHGAGQRYGQDSAQIGPINELDRSRVLLHLVPGPHAYAGAIRDIGPGRVAQVGSPRLDQMIRTRRLLDQRVRAEGAVVGFAWHWDCRMWQEARWAFPFFMDAIPEVAAHWETVGTCHPRDWRLRNEMESWYRDHGIAYEADIDDMLMLVDLLVADNTSAIWEACALDIPVVVLDRPDYRPAVNHGLRFWEYADVGPRIVRNEQLREAVETGFAMSSAYRPMRLAAARYVYGELDGFSLERAIAAIESVVRP